MNTTCYRNSFPSNKFLLKIKQPRPSRDVTSRDKGGGCSQKRKTALGAAADGTLGEHASKKSNKDREGEEGERNTRVRDN